MKHRVQTAKTEHSNEGSIPLNSCGAQGYLRTLEEHGIVPRVSRPGTPSDNANCESFFRTLKREEIDAEEYTDLEDLRLNISAFIDGYYNRKRLHSALGYRPPAKFEEMSDSCDATSVSSAAKITLAAWEGQVSR